MNRLDILHKNLISANTISNPECKFSKTNLNGKVAVITGASRGIGLDIGKALAKEGVKIAILAKTIKNNPTLPGTIYTAAEEIRALGSEALPIQCDIRFEKSVENAVKQIIERFGRIDILINNASAISITNLKKTSMKKFDWMQQVNGRGAYLLCKACYPYLLKSNNPHILNMSPPLFMKQKWFEKHTAYTISKYNMSWVALGLSGEFRKENIAVNTLWPKTYVATTVVNNLLGGGNAIKHSRTTKIISDAALLILSSKSSEMTANFFIDEDVLKKNNITDFTVYKNDPSVREEDLIQDSFIN